MLSSPDVATVVIKTPRGIRFGCSGCADCCLQWPVPLTSRDVDAIEKFQQSGQLTPATRRLPAGLPNMQTFTHSLEKKSDGRCIFLTEENRCRLHAEHGEASKPSMCRLFPYTFSVTPEGICSSVSFASSGALFNSGPLLSEQTDFLRERYELFLQLFPSLVWDWKTAQLLDGVPAGQDWLRTLHHESTGTIAPQSSTPELPPSGMYARLQDMSARAAAQLPSPAAAERMPPVEASPQIIDQLVLKYLGRLYFPADVFGNDTFDLDISGLMRDLVAAPNTVLFDANPVPYRFKDLIQLKLGTLEAALQDLLDRFLYCRVFSWMYFGPGFHHLSLITGIHHLMHLEVLIRLKIKCFMLEHGTQNVEFSVMAEIVRTLERRLTQLQLSTNSKAGLEVLLPGLERAQRIGFLAE